MKTGLKPWAIGMALLGVGALASGQLAGPSPLAWRWAQPTAVAPGGEPIVLEQSVIVAVGSRVYALDRESGNQLWRFPAGEPVQAFFRNGAVLAGSLVVAPADNSTLYAMNAATGAPAWTYLAPQPIVGPVVVAGDAIVMNLGGSSLMAVRSGDGSPLWDRPVDIPEGILGSLGVAGDRVLVFTQDFRLRAYDAATARRLWESQFAILDPTVSASVLGDFVYLVTGDFLVCLSAQNGRGRWQLNLREPLAYAPGVSPDGIVVVSREGRVYSVSPTGRLVTGRPLDLESLPVAPPTAVGSLGFVATSNGALNMIDLKTGDLVWSFIVRPITQFVRQTGETGGTGGGPSGGPGGPAAGGASSGGGGGGAAGVDVGGEGGARGGAGRSGSSAAAPSYVTAASRPLLVGSTVLLLAQDGSLLAFDRQLGVDLTPPNVRMVWPGPGEAISGRPPMEWIFVITDDGTGVKFDTVKVEVDGRPVSFEIDRDGVIFVRFTEGGANGPLSDGRRTITVRGEDWMGNAVTQEFTLTVDNTLRPLGGYRPSQREPGAGTPGGVPGRGRG